MKLVLANIDYSRHMTNEGDQLQRGLEAAGWKLAGAGFDNGCCDVPTLLERHRPDVVFVQDKRDWDPSSKGCFNPKVGFTHLRALKERPDIQKVCVVKDAGSSVEYQKRFCEEIAADAVVTYYHDKSVLSVSPWLKAYPLVRTYHTVDRSVVDQIPLWKQRRGAILTGAANSDVYPLREMVRIHARRIGVEVLRHPGYGNYGSSTNQYLAHLAGYKAHVATASLFKFALRKIIETVAVGATPITDLPEYDRLPFIDAALVRISPNASIHEVQAAVDYAVQRWDYDERMEFSKQALEMYDFRTMGAFLDREIAAVRIHA